MNRIFNMKVADHFLGSENESGRDLIKVLGMQTRSATIKIEPGTEEPSNDDLTAGNAEQVAADDPIITVPKDVDKPPEPVNIKDYVYAFREQEKLRSVHAANAVPGGDAVLTGKCCDKAGKCGCKSYLKYFTSRDSVITGTKAGMRSKERRLTNLELHERHGHLGHCPECKICASIRGSLNLVFQQVDPMYDTRPGYTWNADIVTWDVRNRHGEKYTMVMRDEATGFYEVFNMKLRSDCIRMLSDIIAARREDDKYKYPDYKWMAALKLDLAGEFRPEAAEIRQLCEKFGVSIVYGDPQEKRSMGAAESNNKHIEHTAKAILMQTQLPVTFWGDAVLEAAELRNLYPMARDVKSRDGDSIRPREAISIAKFSRREANAYLRHRTAMGTPCLVYRKGAKQTESTARWGIALGMTGALQQFFCPYQGTRYLFRTKSYMAFKMSPGYSYWEFLGSPIPDEAEKSRQIPTPADDKENAKTVVVKISGLNSMTRGPKERIPTVEGVTAQVLHRNMARPKYKLVDEHDREFVTDEVGNIKMKAGQGVVEDEVQRSKPLVEISETDMPQKSRSSYASCTRKELTALLDSDAYFFVDSGPTFYKRFYNGETLFKGRVVDYAPDEHKWIVMYDQHCEYSAAPDGESEGFSKAQMIKYVINESCAPDKTKDPPAADISAGACVMDEGFEDAPVSRAESWWPRDGTTHEWTRFHLPRDCEFLEACNLMQISEPIAPLYYGIIGEFFGPDGVNSHDEYIGANFQFPWGGSEKAPIWDKINPLQTVIPEGTVFPVPGGEEWKLAVRRHREQMMGANSEVRSAQAVKDAISIIEGKTRQAKRAADIERINIAIAHGQRQLKSENEDEKLMMNAAGGDVITPQGVSKPGIDEKEQNHSDAVHEWPDWTEALKPYIDDKGQISAPKDMTAAKLRPDWPRWRKAYNKEMASLDAREVLSHDHTLTEIRARGILTRPVGMRLMFTVKYLPDGRVDKYKARCIVQGHPGSMFKGVHYNETFSASPKVTTSRILQALSVKEGYCRKTYDIVTAYLWGKSKKDEQIAIRYPAGLRKQFTNKAGELEEYHAIMIGNCYGMPQADRVYSRLRDSEILRMFNKDGWTCRKSRYDPCLFIFSCPGKDDNSEAAKGTVSGDSAHLGKSDSGKARSIPLKGIRRGAGRKAFLSIYTDDCDTVGEEMNDLNYIYSKIKERFDCAECDARFMLGVQRDINDAKTEITLSQPGFIESTYKRFSQHMGAKVNPDCPVPPGLFLYNDPENKREAESKKVMDNGYQSLTGALLWASGRCFPECASGVHHLCRQMCSPTEEGWKAGLHMLRYLFYRKDRGIKFRRTGNQTPVVYYDASNKPEPIKGKRQYGYVIMWMGGPVIWGSRKHRLMSTSSAASEYMALGETSREVRWFRGLLEDMGFADVVSQPTEVLGDNRAAIILSREDLVTPGNRHVLDDYHLSKELIERFEINTDYINTKNNISDLLTKSVSKTEMDALSNLLTGNTDQPLPGADPSGFDKVQRPDVQITANQASQLEGVSCKEIEIQEASKVLGSSEWIQRTVDGIVKSSTAAARIPGWKKTQLIGSIVINCINKETGPQGMAPVRLAS